MLQGCRPVFTIQCSRPIRATLNDRRPGQRNRSYLFVSIFPLQKDIDECASMPCGINSLGCSNLINDYNCTCKAGYGGKRCLGMNFHHTVTIETLIFRTMDACSPLCLLLARIRCSFQELKCFHSVRMAEARNETSLRKFAH